MLLRFFLKIYDSISAWDVHEDLINFGRIRIHLSQWCSRSCIEQVFIRGWNLNHTGVVFQTLKSFCLLRFKLFTMTEKKTPVGFYFILFLASGKILYIVADSECMSALKTRVCVGLWSCCFHVRIGEKSTARWVKVKVWQTGLLKSLCSTGYRGCSHQATRDSNSRRSFWAQNTGTPPGDVCSFFLCVSRALQV